MSDNELKPCPFCGSTNIVPAPLSDYEWYRCLGCDALSGHNGAGGWNKRPIEDAIREDRDSHQRAAISALVELARLSAELASMEHNLRLFEHKYHDAVAELARLTAERDALIEAARWVPVGECCPPTDAVYTWSTVDVMVLCGDEIISPAYYNLDDSALFKRGQWVHRSEVIGGDVTHWRELPAPPEGEA